MSTLSPSPDTDEARLRAAADLVARRGTLEAALAALGPSSDAVRATIARWGSDGSAPLPSPVDRAWAALSRLGLDGADPGLDPLRRLLDGTSADPAALEHAMAGVAAHVRTASVPAVDGLVASSLLAAVDECWRSVASCYRRLHPALRDGDRERTELLLRAHARVLTGLLERVEALAGRAVGDPRPAQPRGVPTAPAAAPPPEAPGVAEAEPVAAAPRPPRRLRRAAVVTGVAAVASAVAAVLLGWGGPALP